LASFQQKEEHSGVIGGVFHKIIGKIGFCSGTNSEGIEGIIQSLSLNEKLEE